MTAVPPQDLGAERAVLGAMLTSADAALTATERLRADDFYRPAHEAVFAALAAAVADREPTDMFAIGTRLAESGELERVGGAPALHDLAAEAPIAAQVGWYADVVLRRAAQRRLALAAVQIAQLAADLDRDPADAAALAGKLIADAADTRAKGAGLRPLGDLLDGALREIEAAGKQGRIPGLSTGVEHLDQMTGGLRPGQLWVVAGRPGMGKSVVGVHWAILAALRARRRVALFSLEMTAAEVVSRVISGETGIPLARITRGRLSDDEWATVTSWTGDISDAPLWIDDSAPLTLADIAARARRLHAREKLDLVVIDYLQLIKPGAGRRDRTREQEVAEITTSLKLLAKELGVPVVIMAQLNRGPEQRVEKRPVLSDMRESGSVEQDVDVALLLYREGYYKADSTKPHELELIVAKHRNGPTGTVIALDDYAHARVYDPHVAPVGGGRAF